MKSQARCTDGAPVGGPKGRDLFRELFGRNHFLLIASAGVLRGMPSLEIQHANERVAVTLALTRAADSTGKLAGSPCFSKQKMPGSR